MYKYSKSKKYFLILRGNSIIIKYPNISHTSQEIMLNSNDIIKAEYYRISSVKAWCMLYNYVLPQCLYITYMLNGQEICKLVGYPAYKPLGDLFKKIGVEIFKK